MGGVPQLRYFWFFCHVGIGIAVANLDISQWFLAIEEPFFDPIPKISHLPRAQHAGPVPHGQPFLSWELGAGYLAWPRAE